MFHLLCEDLTLFYSGTMHLNKIALCLIGEGVVVSQILSPLVFESGAGGVGGFIVGFALKKLTKLMAVFIGLIILLLLYLSSQGIVSINFQALFEAIAGLFGLAGQAFSWLIGVLAIIPFMGTFVVGFLLGFKVG